MNADNRHNKPSEFWLSSLAAVMVLAFLNIGPSFPGSRAPDSDTAALTCSRGSLHVSIPYHAPHPGAGQLTVEVLDPDDAVLGRTERQVAVTGERGWWREEIRLARPLSTDDLVWQRLRYRFAYGDQNNAALEGTESVSQILRMPVIHILGQQSYLTGGQAAVRVIVSDSKSQAIAGASTLRIDLLLPNQKRRMLFSGRLNRRGTTEAQFRFPAGLAGSYALRCAADTPIGSTEFTQQVRLEDKVSILLTTEKPIYQPGQTIHVRALALDRVHHDAGAGRKLTFELEDSRGNKVFRKAMQTDRFGIASAEFGLADEVNLGTYHLRARMGEAEDSSRNTAEIALNVERYVLPKFKVAVDFSGKYGKTKRGYRPGDHVTGTVRANYFFGKPVDGAEITVKASAMDVAQSDAGSVHGTTDGDGAYRFDLKLPDYFTGRPLSHGAARVLIEATVKDSAGHAETRGEPVTVSESPLIITAVPEGGTLVPNLENQVFILTSYPDGKPAAASVRVRGSGIPVQSVTTDEGGVAVVRLPAVAGTQKVEIEAKDREGNHASSSVQLEAREGQEQILLRTERALYRAGEAIQLRVFSTRKRGAAYVDVVKEGQTVLTRDLDIKDGRAQLTLTATPELAGTVDISAYSFGSDARPAGDHRLIFVQPADELKIDAAADGAVYKPGGDARIRFRVTNSRGEGVRAALGLQVVDEAVFALAEKQPGFAKVFFYLEQEALKPRYEIHSIGMPEIMEPVETAKARQRDRAARALFAATEIVSANRFETEYGRDVPQTKYAEYAGRYQTRFQSQLRRLAASFTRAYAQTGEDLIRLAAGMAKSGRPELRDAWDNALRVDSVAWDREASRYQVRSAGPDKHFGTGDDLAGYLELRAGKTVGRPSSGPSAIDLHIEQDRGPFNGRAEIVGTVLDQRGGALDGFSVVVRKVSSGETRTATVNANGRFSLAGLAPGDYEIKVSAGSETLSRKLALRERDRAIVSVMLRNQTRGAVVAVVTQPLRIRIGGNVRFMNVDGIVGGVPGGVAGGVIGGVINTPQAAFRAEFVKTLPKAASGAVIAAVGPAAAPRVRSYFPEALYINPEIITDEKGEASITIPLADSITTWRMAMLASTAHGALGSGASSIKVFQDFFVDLDLPVTLTQGDRVSIPVAVYNYAAARGEVSLKLRMDDWFSLAGDVAEKSLAVDAGRVGGSQFTIEARRIGKFKLTLSARMEGGANGADIIVREIEVIPNGREQNLVFNGRLETTAQHELRFPPAAIADAGKIFVRLYPGPLSQVIEGMDSLLRMPNGCFEQTSSSTYPNVLALDYMKRTRKLTPEVHAKAEGYIANGYQRLLTFEVPDGGFSWFGNAPANKILTAYGLMEFSDMAKVHDVDPKLIQRTRQWLAGRQQADGSWQPDAAFINEGATNRYNSNLLRITAYIAWSLGNTGYQGPAVEKARQFVESRMNGNIDTYTRAVVANFAVDYGKDRDFTRQAMQRLLDARTEKDEQAWWTAEETGVYATGESASVETTGLAAQALLKWGEASATAGKALHYLAAKKDASGTWGTTQATIMALRALLLATEKGTADVQGTVEISLNGKPVQSLTLTADNNDLLHQFVLPVAEAAGAHTVSLRFEGKGGLAYQVVGRYFLPWGERAANEPLSIDVAYDRTHLAQDDIATATATVRNNLGRAANMVMVDLGIPPGFDLLSEDLQEYQEKSAGQKSGRLEKFSLTATQAILYFDSIGARDTVTLRFRLRAKYPIRARTFVSKVYEYYDPAVSAVARPLQLEVRKR